MGFWLDKARKISSNLKKHKNVILLHLLTILLVTAYTMIGGFCFILLEADQLIIDRELALNESSACASDSMSGENVTVESLLNNCVNNLLDLQEWTYNNALVYSFAVMMTVGFGGFTPGTTIGQLFCMIFAFPGIPMAMLVLANIGAYIKETLCKAITKWKKRRRTLGDKSVELDGSAVLLSFVIYAMFGTAWLLIADTSMGFVAALYFTFTALTGGDIGHIATNKLHNVAIKLAYMAIGLAIATIAIDVGSNNLKKLHYFGRKLTNSANTAIWFGGQRLTVKNMVKAVGKKCGVEVENIENLDFEALVKNAIAAEAGEDISERMPIYQEPVIIIQSATTTPEPEPSPTPPSSPEPEPPIPEIVIEPAESEPEPEPEEEFIPPEPYPPRRFVIVFPPDTPPEEQRKLSFRSEHREALTMAENSEPGRAKMRHDPVKRYNVYKKEWSKSARLSRMAQQKQSGSSLSSGTSTPTKKRSVANLSSRATTPSQSRRNSNKSS